MCIDTEDDDSQAQMQRVDPTAAGNKGRYSCSGSSAVSGIGSSQPTTQPNSYDEDEGGITDNAGERQEPGNLSGKAIHPETLKGSHYGGRSKAAETGVSVAKNVEFNTHLCSIDPLFGPHCSHHFGSHLRQAKHKFPRRCGPHVAQKGRYLSY